MTTITFYKYNGHPNTINKVLGTGTDIEGDLRQDFDILRPVLTLRSNTRPTYNYCYINDLGRFYFVDSVAFTGNKGYEMRLRVDVLKTYETEILSALGSVSESEQANPYLSNRNTVYNRQPNFEKVAFPNTSLLNQDGSIIMVTIKGNINN